uniref:cDNA: FLJ21124 fis, clone CAS05964 n=1 Tax=Homo sapiens TaxID=9606 RepID=Q9H7A1_HUMAN|nr:unnamed protein product [Homo sapiens]
MVEISLKSVISHRASKGDCIPVVHSLQAAPQVSEPQSVVIGESSDCERWWRPLSMVEARGSLSTGSCVPSNSSHPAWFTPREPSDPTSNRSTFHPGDSQKPVKRPGATSISRTASLPLLQSPLCPS